MVTKTRLGLTAVVVVAVAGGFAGGRYLPRDLRYVQSEGIAITDYTDSRRLVGVSDAVFIGRVVSQLGTSIERVLPETQFSVTVLESIKGSLNGNVVINQQGGYHPQEHRMVIFEADPLLAVGGTYLFAARLRLFDDGSRWYTVIPNYGDVRISSEAQRQALRSEFHRAYREEIPYNPNEPPHRRGSGS